MTFTKAELEKKIHNILIDNYLIYEGENEQKGMFFDAGGFGGGEDGEVKIAKKQLLTLIDEYVAEDKRVFNRFEVIDWTKEGGGREFTKWTETNFTIKEEVQDGNRTLKVFLEEPFGGTNLNE